MADAAAAGTYVRYHWFGLGVITGTSQLAHTDLVATVMHLWFVPFVVVWLLVMSALVRVLLQPYEADSHLARQWWWGPFCALMVVVASSGLVLGRDPGPALGTGLNSSSASGAFGSLWIAATAIVTVIVVRGEGHRRVWIVLLALLATSIGIKPTVLPVFVAGCLALTVLGVVTGRKRAWVVSLPMAVAAICIFGFLGPLLVGSTGGSRIQLFSLVAGDAGYPSLFASGRALPPASGGLLLPPIADGRPGAFAFTLGIVLLFVLGQSFRLLGLACLPISALRRDPGAWWVAGVVAGGFAAAFLLAHAGLSQQWFALNVAGLGVALTTVVMAATRLAPVTRRMGVLMALTLVVGILAGTGLRSIFGLILPGAEVLPLVLRLLPYLVVVVAATAGLLLAKRSSWSPPGKTSRLVVIGFFVAGLTMSPSLLSLASADIEPIISRETGEVSRSQQEAALWLGANSAHSDIVVTNVFCRPVRYRPECNHTSAWLGALSGRQQVLGGWAYLPETQLQYDGTEPVRTLPSPFPDRLRDSLAVIVHGDRRAACRLHQTYGATWVFADRGATEVSPKIGEFATHRYENDAVVVFEMDDAKLRCSEPGERR